MNNYVAPRRDIHFLLNDCFGIDNGTDFSEVYGNLTSEEVNAIIYAYSDFAEKEVAPINFSGDQEGAQWNDGAVTTPKGFKESYRRYIEQGWASLVYPSEFGGQELTTVLRSVHNEIFSGSNMAWSCYVGLSQFATSGIEANGNESQKHRFLPKMVAGNWTGTMCLTESHCGSDLGLIRTKANPRGDGTYSISGTKIFISGGEHDLSENIVNLVLARVEGAANGVKGLSLFIVPKFKVDDHGVIKERNSVNCLSIEHKMGIHANATCVLNFQDAEGILLGNEGDGLKGMFVCMNQARIGTALQALGTADAAFQKALAYSKERTQMRSLTSPNLKADADRIIVHPDVRRMLLIQKSLTEGGRAFTYYISLLLSKHEISNQRDPGLKGLIDISTPICKGFMTEIGIEVATLSVQIYGGHGYIQESKVEQLLRDVRITTIYEGTTGIQGLDLFVKKVLGTNGNLLKDLFLNFDNLIKNVFMGLHGKSSEK